MLTFCAVSICLQLESVWVLNVFPDRHWIVQLIEISNLRKIMHLVSNRRRQPSINIVPLVDVLTVLLFFFMVTMQFKQMSTLNITVPEIKTAGKNEIKERVVIALSPEGELYLNDQLLESDAFEQAVALIGEATPELPVLLIADENVPLKHVTEVMDICRSNQLNKISLQSR